MKDQSIQSVKAKIARYCVYQDRAETEVRMKLMALGVNTDVTDQLIEELKQERFIDDERFAKAFAGGKFRTKKWGKVRIRRELKIREIDDTSINEGLKEIDEQAYIETLESLANQKFALVKGKDLFVRKHKTANFLLGKGYEADLIWEVLEKVSGERKN